MKLRIMSGSVCHAPLPPKMEAFRARLCLRAVDQYERLLRNHFNKTTKNRRDKEGVKHQTTSTNTSLKKESIISNKGVTESTHSAVNVFRQWRKNQRTTDCNGVRMGVGPSTASLTKRKRNLIYNLDKFPLILSNTTMPEEDLSLKYLALNALDLTAPASDILLKNRRKAWFQLSGHPDGFAPAGPGTVWKRRAGGDENTERLVYEELGQDDLINKFVPKYYREVVYNGDAFIELQDLLFGFKDPHVIDIKLGTRTFLESEVSKTNARSDLYEKMVAVDQNAPTSFEHECKAVTKLRYMQFREEQSSTRSHGFRIEAMKFPGQPPISDLKKVKDHDKVLDTMRRFFEKREDTCEKALERLREMRKKFEQSDYFQTHEIIGSSILMIYDEDKVGVWLIDFAKTHPVTDGKRLTHRTPWVQGNHEEGFLLGLDNLISVIEQVQASC